MSQENVEVVRRVYDFWNRGDFEAAVKMLDPRVLWHGYSHLPEAGPREGIDEVRRWADAFREAWGEIQVRVERLIDVDDQSVLALVRMMGRGRGSGAAVVSGLDGHVWSVREGRVVAVHMYQGARGALEAVGLRE
jgi:ketosteroid isomerase-like protein